jgi:hypothetical protein
MNKLPGCPEEDDHAPPELLLGPSRIRHVVIMVPCKTYIRRNHANSTSVVVSRTFVLCISFKHTYFPAILRRVAVQRDSIVRLSGLPACSSHDDWDRIGPHHSVVHSIASASPFRTRNISLCHLALVSYLLNNAFFSGPVADRNDFMPPTSCGRLFRDREDYLCFGCI